MNAPATALAALALFTTAPQAYAQESKPAATSVQAKRNQTVVDSGGHVLGKIYEVNAAQGVITFFSQMRIYSLPISTLSADGARLKTTMTRAQLGL